MLFKPEWAIEEAKDGRLEEPIAPTGRKSVIHCAFTFFSFQSVLLNMGASLCVDDGVTSSSDAGRTLKVGQLQ